MHVLLDNHLTRTYAGTVQLMRIWAMPSPRVACLCGVQDKEWDDDDYQRDDDCCPLLARDDEPRVYAADLPVFPGCPASNTTIAMCVLLFRNHEKSFVECMGINTMNQYLRNQQ